MAAPPQSDAIPVHIAIRLSLLLPNTMTGRDNGLCGLQIILCRFKNNKNLCDGIYSLVWSVGCIRWVHGHFEYEKPGFGQRK